MRQAELGQGCPVWHLQDIGLGFELPGKKKKKAKQTNKVVHTTPQPLGLGLAFCASGGGGSLLATSRLLQHTAAVLP